MHFTFVRSCLPLLIFPPKFFTNKLEFTGSPGVAEPCGRGDVGMGVVEEGGAGWDDGGWDGVKAGPAIHSLDME